MDANAEQQKSYDEELDRLTRVYQVKPDEATKFPDLKFQGNLLRCTCANINLNLLQA